MQIPFLQYLPKSDSRSISPSLLWEYDLSSFDWERSRRLVVQRVIERGRLEDFVGAINRYGGIEAFRETIKEVPHLSDKDIAFVCTYFNLNKDELLCYRRKQSRERHLTS